MSLWGFLDTIALQASIGMEVQPHWWSQASCFPPARQQMGKLKPAAMAIKLHPAAVAAQSLYQAV